MSNDSIQTAPPGEVGFGPDRPRPTTPGAPPAHDRDTHDRLEVFTESKLLRVRVRWADSPPIQPIKTRPGRAITQNQPRSRCLGRRGDNGGLRRARLAGAWVAGVTAACTVPGQHG